MSDFRIFLVCGVLLAALSVGYLAIEPEVVSAADKQVWITIDQSELETVLAVRRQRGSKPLDIQVATVEGGIAVARLSGSDLETLSAEMHVKFRKCAGYMVHDSSRAALADIEGAVSAETAQLFTEYSIDNQPNVNRMIAETRESSIRQTILDLSAFHTRRHDQPSGLESAAFIKESWETLAASREDMSVEYYDNTGQGGTSSPQPSIILTITGTFSPSEIVVLGAHQDSIRVGGSGNAAAVAPGADDDASGIAVLTEAIRIIVEKDFRPNRTVQFMAYAAEEVGLRGSRNIAAEYNANGVDVIGVIQFDMTNYSGDPAIDVGMVTDFTNDAQNQFIVDLYTEYLPGLNVVNTACGYACSDHASWTNNGFPASFPFESNLPNSNSLLHTENDTISQSGNNADHAENFAKMALAFAGELAKGSLASPDAARFDFDGDFKADISVFRPGPAEWWYLRSSDGGYGAFQFGQSTDKPVPGDFTGDGTADFAFWRESTGEWFVLRSEDLSFFSFPFGASGDIPSTGDFDGDGLDDPAVFRPATGNWFILRSSDGGTDTVAFGANGDIPLAADYDNDGIDDIALYRPSSAQFWLLRSNLGLAAYQFGAVGDLAMGADFTGDGTADIAVWNPQSGDWFVLRSEDESYFGFQFGAAGDIPAPADYDGDGIADPSVFRPADNTWYSLQSTNGTQITAFGITADFPVPGSYVAGQ